jgi:hypothetical protein
MSNHYGQESHMQQKTKKQKILELIAGRNPGALSWSTIIDQYAVIESLPERLSGATPLDFYRHIGCDIFIFGGLGLKESGLAYGMPYSTVNPDIRITREMTADGLTKIKTESAHGLLTRVENKGYVLKHEVETIEDVYLLSANLERTVIIEDHLNRDREDAIAAAIGDDGVQFHSMEPSPVQNLIEYYMGLDRFYFLLQDHPEAVENLIELLHDILKRKYTITCRNSNREAVIAVENTSTTLISPMLYRQYSRRHIDDYTEIVHAYDKKLIVHMCGYLYHLLPVFNEMSFDAIHALSPPPFGDTTLEDLERAVTRDLYILGGIKNFSFLERGVSKELLYAELDQFYTDTVRARPFTLALPGDGIVTQYDNFMYLSEWFARQ